MTTLSGFYQQVRETRPVEPIILDDPIPLEALQTPALIIDLDVFDANLARMQSYVRQQKISLRAHTKMHKCPIIARKQIEGGASGVCAARSARRRSCALQVSRMSWSLHP